MSMCGKKSALPAIYVYGERREAISYAFFANRTGAMFVQDLYLLRSIDGKNRSNRIGRCVDRKQVAPSIVVLQQACDRGMSKTVFIRPRDHLAHEGRGPGIEGWGSALH